MMVETTHTPGPWRFNEQAFGFKKYSVISSEIAFVYINKNKCFLKGETIDQLQIRQISDFKLMAAAPDMYEFIHRWLSSQTIAGVTGSYPEGSFGWKAQQILKKIDPNII